MSVATKLSTPSTLNDLISKEKELQAKRKELKALQDRRAWEAKTKARNPAYLVGSLRPATAQDEDLLGHVHGWVCTIECQMCGEHRIVNKQDAFQAKFCKGCVVEARKAKSKARRLEKRVEGKSVASIEDEIARLDTKLAEMQ